MLFLVLSFCALAFADNPPIQAPVEVMPPPEMMPEAIKGYEGAFLKMILTFVALIVGVFFTVWALKRLSRGHLKNLNANRAIKILEKRPLSPKTMLYLVEIGEKQTLIAESQLEVKSLVTFESSSAEEETNKTSEM